MPTWNEEAWLPLLLDRLSRQEAITEIIVSDNHSHDATPAIARDFGCRVIEGGRPAAARNRGAAVAQGARLLFVDADVVPPTAALSRAADPDLPAAAWFRTLPMSDDRLVHMCYSAMDTWFTVLDRAGITRGLANFLITTRAAFRASGGFNEHINPGEDVDLVRRLAQVAPVSYERQTPVYISARRLVTEPRCRFAIKTAIWEGTRMARSDRTLLPYRWVAHDPRIATAEQQWLARRANLRGW